MAYSKVVYIRTSPDTVLSDIGKLMRLTCYTDVISPDRPIILGIDLSWHHFFPSSSSTPWQIDGVIGTLIEDGFAKEIIIPLIASQPGVSGRFGEILNRHRMAVEKHGLSLVHSGERLNQNTSEAVDTGQIAVKTASIGVFSPSLINNNNLIVLPTMKTHHAGVFAGSMYTICGVFAGRTDRYSRQRFHEHIIANYRAAISSTSHIFAIMDGSFAGFGPGPMRLFPRLKNVIAASGDPVALDAVAAHLMGYDPLTIPYIRMAHDEGLGVGDPQMIEIVGETLPEEPQGITSEGSSIDSFLWKLENGGFPCGGLLSQMYTDWYWMLRVGEKRMKPVMKTGWGTLFESYRK